MKHLFIFCCLALSIANSNGQHHHLDGKLTTELNKVDNIKKRHYSDAFRFNRNAKNGFGIQQRSPIKQRLDSVVTYSVNPSRVTSKFDYQYNADGLETSSSSQFLDDMTNTLKNSSKTENKYDGSSRLVQYFAYVGEGNAWVNFIRNDFSYDNQDLVNSQIAYIWNKANAVWQNEIKTIYSYDANKFLILAIDSLWDENKKKWNLNTKAEITNDAAGRPLTVIISFWNTSFKQWDYAARDEIKYNQAGQEISYINSIWDENNFDWQYTARFLNNRNGVGSVILYLVSSWDGTQWVDLNKSEYMLDGNQNMVSEMYYIWDDNMNRWNLLLRANCSYDNAFPFDKLILPFNTGFDTEVYFKHQLNKVMYFHENAGNLIHDENVLLYYSPVNVTGTKNIKEAQFILIPNLVNDHFKIAGDDALQFDLKIIRLDGVEVFSRKVFSNELINATELYPGLYLYRLINEEKLVGKGMLQVIR